MQFFYSLINLLIPICLLSFISIVRAKQQLSVQYGKWMMLIMLIFVLNLFFYIFEHSYVFLLIDLCMKIGVVFLPDIINQKIQAIITKMHLEMLLDHFRCKFLNVFFNLFVKCTEFVLRKMEKGQRLQFKEALIEKLNCVDDAKQKSSSKETHIKSGKKCYQQFGVNCTLITTSIKMNNNVELHNNSSKVGFYQKHEAQKQYTDQPKSNKDLALEKRITASNVQERKQLTKNQNQKQKRPEQPSDTISISSNLKQSSNFFLEDYEEEEKLEVKPNRVTQSTFKGSATKPSTIKKQIPSETITRRNTDIVNKSYKKSSNLQQKQPEELINKLDISVSEYSDMFEEDRDEQDFDAPLPESNNKNERTKSAASRLICKVEAIVEIGTENNTRLQIYNLELYSNNKLRIMSLYDRQFEAHTLVSLVRQENNYFELHLINGTINKRRVKFRGQYQPFLKYATI